jgi:hypothetical protein
LSARAPAAIDPLSAVGRRIRYVARFEDGDAARMHVHQLLRRRLLDANARLYRADLTLAIAAAESLDLRHTCCYMDPGLGTTAQNAIEEQTHTFVRRRQRVSLWLHRLGYLALTVLLLRAIASLM